MTGDPRGPRRRRLSVSTAAWRYWPLVALPAIALCVVAIAVASQRKPNYTAEARVTVSPGSVEPASLGSFVVAANALAAGYSRAVDGEGVLRRVSQSVKVSEGEASTALTASPVPESPVIRIQAVTDSRQKAVALANAASDALIAYTTELNRSEEDSNRIFAQYQRAAVDFERARVVRQRVAADVRARRLGEIDLAKAEAKLNSQRLRLDALGAAYQTSQRGQASTRLLQVLSRAVGASSDRTAKIQIAAFAGLMAGLLIGLAAAVARANRITLRGSG